MKLLERVRDVGLRRHLAKATIEWYRENEGWWRAIKSGEYMKYYEEQYVGR